MKKQASLHTVDVYSPYRWELKGSTLGKGKLIKRNTGWCVYTGVLFKASRLISVEGISLVTPSQEEKDRHCNVFVCLLVDRLPFPLVEFIHKTMKGFTFVSQWIGVTFVYTRIGYSRKTVQFLGFSVTICRRLQMSGNTLQHYLKCTQYNTICMSVVLLHIKAHSQ